jgi:4a-hydroxytetrahydrobiopterin dehydratase
MKLQEEKCTPITAETKPFSKDDAQKKMPEIPHWELKDKAIERQYKFEDFREAMEFVNDVAEVANHEDHHPDIHISYNKVTIELSTHKIGGLSENDFIMAAKINEL